MDFIQVTPEQRIILNNAFYGFDDFQKRTLDLETIKTVCDISELEMPDYQMVELPFMKKKEVKEKTKAFCGSKLLFHNVGTLSDSRAFRVYKKAAKLDDPDAIAKMYNSAAKIVSPFKVHLDYEKTCVIAGSLTPQVFYMEDFDKFIEVLKKINVYFKRINLPHVVSEFSVPCYIHELVHTQLKSQKGIVDDYYDDEVLSIFMELLYAYEHKEIYTAAIMNRVNCLCRKFNLMYLYQNQDFEELAKEDPVFDEVSYLDAGKYLFSILKAFKLLDIYIGGNYSVKKEILIHMQSVLDGAKCLSEQLNYFGVNYESSLDKEVTKRLLTK